MISVFVQSIPATSRKEFPFRITILDDSNGSTTSYLFRPDCALPKRLAQQLQLDRMEILNAPPFCDVAEDLIEAFEDQNLRFFNAQQFLLIKGLFRTIGFNFSVAARYYFSRSKKDVELQEDFLSTLSRKRNPSSTDFPSELLELLSNHSTLAAEFNKDPRHEFDGANSLIKDVKNAAGVYFFYDKNGDVIYVGKAKNLRKRLQSHFSKKETKATIDYDQVAEITVEYTGNDVVAQLVESENIKRLRPVFNSQQVNDAAPYIINIGSTASGISKASIVRKDYTDNLPERYFNRESVKKALEDFCTSNDLCRKNCGLEKIKGPCTRSRVRKLPCVCAGDIEIEIYNKKFAFALDQWSQIKTRHFYKLAGRSENEDAFVYLLNGIYQGYGFIDREDSIRNENDVLSRMKIKPNNYDTNRIVSKLLKNDIPMDM